MLPNLAESLVENVKRIPGKAKEKTLNTLRNCYDIVKGSDSIKEEINKQINTLVKTPLEAGGSALTAGNQLIHRHPIQATKSIANGLIETTKNVTKMGLAPLSGTITVARSGIKTGAKIVTLPITKTFGAFQSIQRTNEKLFSLSDKFKEWNKLKPVVETEHAEDIAETDAEKSPEKKVPALMQVPGSETVLEQAPDATPNVVQQAEPVKQNTPVSTEESKQSEEKTGYSQAA